MKPVYLEFCGVNSFSEKAVIDFRKLLSGGVFGIFGDTGSGKSTILDCIHIALYGKLERSTETECINHKCDGFTIIFEFESVSQGVRNTYRVERSRNRKKKVEAKLYERGDDGKWMALADGVTEVKEAIVGILGLEYDDFKMCIALPQGKFSSLVKAGPKERLGLVSRLFDLGRFGDKLNIVIRERRRLAEGEVQVLSGQMKGADECSEERIAAEETALAQLQEDIRKSEEECEAAQAKFDALKALHEETIAYEKCVKQCAEAEEKLEGFEALKAALKKLPLAKDYCARAAAVAKAQAAIAEEEARLKVLDGQIAQANTEQQRAQTALTEAEFDSRLGERNNALGKLEAAKADVTARNGAKKRLDDAIAAYKSIEKQLQDKNEDFAGELGRIEARLAQLGEDEGLSLFVKRNFSQEVKNEIYGQVRGDLKALGEQHPEAADDIAKLLQKYAPMQGGEAFDFAAAKAKYDALEQERRDLQKTREAVVARKQAYEQLLGEKELLLKTGKHAREEYEAADEKIAGVKGLGTIESVNAEIAAIKKQKEAAEERVRNAQTALNELLAKQATALAAKAVHETNFAQAKEAFEAVAAEGNFADLAAAQAIVDRVGDEQKAAEAVELFFRERHRLLQQKAEAEARGVQRFSMDEYAAAKAQLTAATEKKSELLVQSGKCDNALKSLKENAKKYAETQRKLNEATARMQEWEKLLKLLTANRNGGTLMEFVASEYLRDICEAATLTLLKLTGGRYFLKYNADFFVGDNLDGGNLRQVSTLSGGETFLVSLSLALSLSAAICQKSMRPAEFFFLDEGFGTLDRSLVDTVMDVLGKVSAEFSVGLISHVDELKARIENKIEVTGATKTQGSSVRVVAY